MPIKTFLCASIWRRKYFDSQITWIELPCVSFLSLNCWIVLRLGKFQWRNCNGEPRLVLSSCFRLDSSTECLLFFRHIDFGSDEDDRKSHLLPELSRPSARWWFSTVCHSCLYSSFGSAEDRVEWFVVDKCFSSNDRWSELPRFSE